MGATDDWCGLCGEPITAGEHYFDLMDGNEERFKAHESCATTPLPPE